ncbi:DNA repair protein RecN [Limibacillus halophilus]|uniref:DNA repair protein RecN n=1 Tax=Limibacillus halophilus TaxID=1579333 RepID=A0A839SPL3_9PROT|nr:DNA repair protein RecN [Limibacillus halophilus]MBB3064837.1 DNA repair protein RecN (Recombination protein N) [Limibacillus halophilus]
MLAGLSIRDVVLIDRLDLQFESGLVVLTGETGAGKSILLDSLGLALGERSDSGLLRPGADKATVIASFEAPLDHPLWLLLDEGGVEIEPGEPLLLRRQVSADGRSRAFVNDQPVSVTLLRQLGESLVEVQGHFEQRGLLDPKTHRKTLDLFGGLRVERTAVEQAWARWQNLRTTFEAAQEKLANARRDEDFLRHAIEELARIDPQEGEEEALAERRALLLNAGQLLEAMQDALTQLDSAERPLAAAQRRLEQMSDKAAGRLDGAVSALGRALAETEEARETLQALASDGDFEGEGLQQIEDRYFALKDLARKHRVEVSGLSDLHRDMSEQLAAIDSGDAELQRLEKECGSAEALYWQAADALSKRRKTSAEALDVAVNAELPPLKLDKARFRTAVEKLDPDQAGPSGCDRVVFEVATNPGSPPGALGRIASAGELSRFLLALKLVLAEASPVTTLVFDEVDSGVGGATAAAVGDRLSRLAEKRQILVVTHSPQVASRGRQHWHVEKQADQAQTVTNVRVLDSKARREEIARMLSGASITEEARAAAAKLIGVPE